MSALYEQGWTRQDMAYKPRFFLSLRTGYQVWLVNYQLQIHITVEKEYIHLFLELSPALSSCTTHQVSHLTTRRG
jgi:hypothetical protein